MIGELPPLIRFLVDSLKFNLRRRDKAFDYEFFLLDLSAWKLRLSDRTPFIQIRASHLDQELSKLIASLRAAIQNQYFQNRINILMVDGPASGLVQAVQTHLPLCVVLDGEDIQNITSGTVSDARLLELLSARLPIASLSPYEISSPVTGSRFFGREYELRRILNHPETDFVILGNRRIGKTSLLQELKRRMEESGQEGVYFFDCSVYDSQEAYIRAVVTEVDIRARERMWIAEFPHFLRLKSYRGKRRLTFLLDEFDRLVDIDRQSNWSLLQTLRASSKEGFCRYILAGYREIMEQCLDNRSPLFNFATELTIGNFDLKETRQLVSAPMSKLGVTLQREGDLVSQIFQETAGHPNLVQFYCYTLVQLMDREERREIGPQDLAVVHNDPEFERFIFRTFASNTNDLEKAIVYSLVRDCEQFTPREIDAALKARGVQLTSEQIFQACDHLRIAGVLDRTKDQGQIYAFAIPILARLLKDYDLEFLFEKAREDGNL